MIDSLSCHAPCFGLDHKRLFCRNVAQTEGKSLAWHIDFDDAHTQMLSQGEHCGGVLHVTLGHLGYMDESLGVDAYVNKGTEACDVGDDAWQNHSAVEVLERVDIGGEREFLERLARVAAGFLQLGEDVVECGQAHFVSHVSLEVNLCAHLG